MRRTATTAGPTSTSSSAIAQAQRPRILYLANPDNPSGTFIDARRHARFYEALPRDTLLLLDEAYADFVDESIFLPPIFEDRLIRLRTFSKAYGMAGARIGYALTTERNVRTFQKIRLHYGVNRNAQIGALASLQDDGFRDHVVARDRAGARRLLRARARAGPRLHRVAHELRLHRHGKRATRDRA